MLVRFLAIFLGALKSVHNGDLSLLLKMSHLLWITTEKGYKRKCLKYFFCLSNVVRKPAVKGKGL